MNTTRRDVLLSALGLTLAGAAGLAGPAHARALRSSQPEAARGSRPAFAFKWSEAGRSGIPTFCRVGFGEGGNSLAIIESGAGAVLVDTKNSPFGEQLAQDVSALDALPIERLDKGQRSAKVAAVINTHHHFDHTGGNHAFTSGESRTPIVAHAKAADRIAGQVKLYQDRATVAMRTMAGSQDAAVRGRSNVLMDRFGPLLPTWTADTFRPTDVIDAERTERAWGGVKVVLWHFGAGHTDNDVVVQSEDHNVIHAGDLLFHKVWPFFDRPAGANTAGWIRSLKRIIALCDDATTIVPGHGEITDRAGAQGLIDFFEDLIPRAQAAVKAGKTREQFIAEPTPAYDSFAAGDWIRPITLGGLYDEAAGA